MMYVKCWTWCFMQNNNFEILTVFPPKDFLFLSPMQAVGFLGSFLRSKIRQSGARLAGLPGLVSKTPDPYSNRKFVLENKYIGKIVERENTS